MTIILIIISILAAAYIFAAVTYYYGFKNWYPLCGCKLSTGRSEELQTTCQASNSTN